jgi:phosphoglycerate dehydrogenase-like enzyme
VHVLVPFDVDAPAGITPHIWASGALPDAVALDAVEMHVLPYTFDAASFAAVPVLPRLRILQTLTAGYEHVLRHLPDGVTLCNARGVHDDSTAELALTLMLTSQRGVPDFVRAQHEHRWAHAAYPSLADRRVLVVGFGGVGRAIAARLEPFGCRVTPVASAAGPGVYGVSDLPTLLPEAEIIVLAVPLTDATRGMVDAEFLRRMADGALLVNVSRGPVVDTEALVAQTSAGRLRAALDVTDPEPLPAEHPLWSSPGVLISPHVGGNTSAFWPRARRLVEQQLTRISTGQPPMHQVAGPTLGP